MQKNFFRILLFRQDSNLIYGAYLYLRDFITV